EGNGDGVTSPGRTRELGLGFGFPRGHVKQSGLGVQTGLSDENWMFEETANEEDQRNSDDDHRRAQGNRKGYEDAEIHLQEVALQRLRTQINRHYSDLGISN